MKSKNHEFCGCKKCIKNAEFVSVRGPVYEPEFIYKDKRSNKLYICSPELKGHRLVRRFV